MSLVNDMLRDLEQRNEKPAQVPGNTPQVKAAQYVEEPETSAVSPTRIVLWLIGIVAIGATLWLLWQDYSKKQAAQPLVIKAGDSKPEEKLAKKQIVAPVTPTNIKEPAPEVAVNAVNENTNIAAEVIPGKVSIDKVRWSGTDSGGDLVVTLSAAADIQLVSQDERVITVSFEKVAMTAPLPMISSSLVQRLDVNRDDERILLTLTATQPSRFAFRVQQSPTTLILGVLPDQRFIARQDPVKSVATVVETPKKVTPVASTKSDLELTTPVKASSVAVDPESETPVDKPEPKPVTKAKRELSDKQVAARARKLLNQADLEAAEQLLQNRIAKHPQTSAEARGLLATLMLSTGNLSKAKEVITNSLAIHPQDGGLRKLQSRLWIAEGKSAQVVSLLQQNTPLLAKDPEYYELLASAYQQVGDYERSAKTYYQLLQHSREIPRWWVGMGYALEQSRHYTEARDAYLSALKVVGIEPSLKSYAEQRAKALLGR
ncbi:tetratricopeptide repeat protein [Neptuniibacter sp.]|uniref:tetratricopeptide repeat protein n=1 Tax=Neptuniibacter sp. TaxID=1962643 RepID=UPI0026356B12|nr:tetratricopeptide repeat protein [Neptuniibacter sp.]MCP4597300.1 tetratricopeptide repeat protein [Neptuniibacter sp.]